MTSNRPSASTISRHLLSVLALAGIAAAAWAGWLGWDQQRDVHPDGHTTGPYEAWQVIGLVLTLLGAVVLAASRRHHVGAVLGTATGLAVATWYDWSDDGSGLFVIGVFLVTAAALAGTTLTCVATAAVMRNGRSPHPTTA
ncbi:hypothetical protein [Streptomyces sp. NPDC002640]